MAIVLVTGASRGIGKAIVELLANKGHTVFATMRDPKGFKGFDAQGDIHILSLDVISAKEIQTVIDDIARIDVLINNAGFGLFSPIECATLDEIHYQFDVNVYGPIRMIQAVLPKMREQKSGHIINISSIAAMVSHPFLGVYSATKRALEAMSEALQVNLFPFNIKVTVIEPGRTKTGFGHSLHTETSDKVAPYEPHYSQSLQQITSSLEEGQDPKEIAELVSLVLEGKIQDFRIQTSPHVKEIAKHFVTDPTLNGWINEQKLKF